MSIVYLDNSTTTRPSAEAVSKMLTFFTEKWGTPIQPHQMGQAVIGPLEEAYRALYELLGASEKDTVIITSSAAESVNHAILSTYQDVSLKEGKNHFISSVIEEAPAMISLSRLESFGCSTSYLKPNARGILTPQALIEAITPRTALVALSWASGLTGLVQPIVELAEICKSRGIRFLVEGTHVLGKLFFELKDLPIDFFAFNGEQIHGPKGTGGLYIKEGIHLSPFILGGVEQAGLRAGSVNVPGAVALGVAAKQALAARDYLSTEVARLKFYFEKDVLKKVPFAKILFQGEERLPNVTAISFPHIVNEALLFSLHRKGVFACIGGGSQQQLSYLLEASGVDKTLSGSAISFSLSRETREEELDQAASALEASVLRLKKGSNRIFEGVV